MQVCRTLELWFQDRDSTKGMLSSIGMGTRSTLDVKFRMVVRIIYTYLVVRLTDKGLSIHHGTDTGHAGGGGGVLAWRKGRQSSAQSLGDGSSVAPGGGGSGGKHESRDASTVLIEALAQLPAKNKDYAIVFVTPPNVGVSVHKTGSAATTAAMTMALLPALASSPLDIVKRTIMSTPSPPLAPGSPPTTSNVSTPTYGLDRRRDSHSRASSVVGGHNKRLSIQSHHSRFSTSSWDDTAGMILFPEDMNEFSNGLSSPLSPTAAATAAGELAATRRRVGGSSSQQPTEYRVRLQQGTKNGMEDLVWAVAQIKDRRFRILEAADFMEEVLERFYDGDDYFA